MYKKFINGHGSCYGLWDYLLHDKETGQNRSIFSKTYNLIGEDGDGNTRPWYELMDRDRELFGTTQSTNGKKPLTFKHYVLAPDPKDNLTPEHLENFIDEWLEKGFCTEESGGKFQVAVEMHNDNGKLHAHVVFNNINLNKEWEKGKRITGYLTPNMLKQTQDLVNQLAAKRGWHNFLEKDAEDTEKAKSMLSDELIDINEISHETKILQNKQKEFFERNNGVNPQEYYRRPIDIAANGSINATRKGSYINKQEAEILKKQGWSYKEDIRKCIDIAVYLSSNLDEFYRVLRCLNLPCKINNRGEFVFSHPKETKRMFTGYKLGWLYTRKGVIQRLQIKESQVVNQAKRKYYTGKLAGIGVVAVYHYDTDLNIHELAKVAGINSKYNIWDNEDYDKRLASLSDSDLEAREDILWAKERNMKIYAAKPPIMHVNRINKELERQFVHEMSDAELRVHANNVWKKLGYGEYLNEDVDTLVVRNNTKVLEILNTIPDNSQEFNKGVSLPSGHASQSKSPSIQKEDIENNINNKLNAEQQENQFSKKDYKNVTRDAVNENKNIGVNIKGGKNGPAR